MPEATPRWIEALRFGLIPELRLRQVVTIDPRAYLNLEAWFSAAGTSELLSSTPSLARGAVRAILCKSSEEQAGFDAVFDRWLDEFQRASQSSKRIAEKPPQVGWKWGRLLTPPGLLGILIVAVVLAVVFTLIALKPGAADTPVGTAGQPVSSVEVPASQAVSIDKAASQVEAPTPTEVSIRTPILSLTPTVRLFGVGPMIYLAAAGALLALNAALVRRARVTRSESSAHLREQEVYVRKLLPVAGSRRRLIRDAVRILRLRGQSGKRALDVSKSINASAARAGLFSQRYRTVGSAMELLVLVDRSRPDDQQAYWAIESVRDLAAEGVSVSIWEYDRDPRWLSPVGDRRRRRREPLPRYLPLKTVAASHAEKGLIIITNGEELIDPGTGQLHAWVSSALSPWPRRVLVTPRPMASWGAAEDILAGDSLRPDEPSFLVLPQQAHSWLAAAMWLRNGSLAMVGTLSGAPAVYPVDLAMDSGRWITSSPPSKGDRQELLADLLGYLGPAAYAWLAASASYPVVSAELTAYFAHGMTAGEPMSGAKTPLMDARLLEARLVAIAQLPWSRHAHMPDWLRLDLLASLPQGTRQHARRLLETLFDQAFTGGVGSSSGSLGRLASEVPKSRRWRNTWLLRHLGVHNEPASSPLRDAIYVGMLRGDYDKALDPAATDTLLRAVRAAGLERMSANPLRWLGAIVMTLWFCSRWVAWLAASLADRASRRATGAVLQPGAKPE